MNKISKLKLFLSSLTLIATLGVSPLTSADSLRNDPAIRDMSNRSSYEPGGSRHLFSSRGNVTKRKGKINTISSQVQAGLLKMEIVRVRGKIGYETHFPGHTWQVHAPFDNHGSRSESDSYGKINAGGMTSYKLKWSGTEVHPANGYDGEQGGGYPAPKGARDIYNYNISGSAARTTLDLGLPPTNNKPKEGNQPVPQANNENQQQQEKQKEADDIEAMTKGIRWLMAGQNEINGSWTSQDLINMGKTPFVDTATQNKQDAYDARNQTKAKAQGVMDGSNPSYDNISPAVSNLDQANGYYDYYVGSWVDFAVHGTGAVRKGKEIFNELPPSVQEDIRSFGQGVNDFANDNPNLAVILGTISRGVGVSQTTRTVGGAVASAASGASKAVPKLPKPNKGSGSHSGKNNHGNTNNHASSHADTKSTSTTKNGNTYSSGSVGSGKSKGNNSQTNVTATGSKSSTSGTHAGSSVRNSTPIGSQNKPDMQNGGKSGNHTVENGNKGDTPLPNVPVRQKVEIDFEKSKIKGTPENDLVNNLKPNTDYELSNGTKFSTNAHGYVDSISFKPDFDNPAVRNSSQTSAVGKEGIDGDVGGHIQACVFGGTCDRYNLFPQNGNFNNSAYKTYFENVIRKAHKEGKNVDNVTVDFYRSDPSSPRPDTLTVTYTIDGEPFRQNFKNEAGGGITK